MRSCRVRIGRVSVPPWHGTSATRLPSAYTAMRSITYKFISVLLCFTLSLWLLLGSLALPRRAHAVLPVLGGAAVAAGVSDVAYIGAFAAFLAACGFSLASAVGADPNAPVASWSDEQLERAADKLQSWIDHAAEVSSRVELQQMLNEMPEPPEEPPDDDPDDDPPEVEGEKVQPKKSDASNPMDYMLALMAVNGGVGLASGFGGAISSLVDWATTPENDGGGGFLGNAVYPDSVTDPVTSLSFRVDEEITPSEYGINRNGPPSGYSCDIYTQYSSSRIMIAFPSDAHLSLGAYTSSTSSYRINFDGSSYALGYMNFWTTSSDPAFVYAVGSSSVPAGSVVSPRVAAVINPSFTTTGGQILNAIQGGNDAILSALGNMATNQAAAVATLQDLYSHDVSQSQVGTPQYLTVQAPYYVESGKTDPQTGQYTAHVVANDYNHGTVSQYDDAVATNTSSPQPGNTGYNPSDYKGNSSSDVPPWQPLLDIHLDRVWPFSLIGDALGTFNDVYSLDGGESWDWHIVVPLSSWNIALGGSHVFDDYDIDLSMWRELFAYLAPWFLLYVFLALLAMARRLWLRWNDGGGDD